MGIRLERSEIDLFNYRIKKEYKAKGYISAIKLFRKIHKCELKEAKKKVEKITNHKWKSLY